MVCRLALCHLRGGFENMKTPAEKIRLAAQIRAMARDGAKESMIAKHLNTTPQIVRRVLSGNGVAAFSPIDNVPTVQGELDKNGWPVDEQATTDSIYAAAAAIREIRPRNPVGYQEVEIELRASIIAQRLPRGGVVKL